MDRVRVCNIVSSLMLRAHHNCVIVWLNSRRSPIFWLHLCEARGPVPSSPTSHIAMRFGVMPLLISHRPTST